MVPPMMLLTVALAVLGVDSYGNGTDKTHTTSKGFLIGGRDVNIDKATASDGSTCKFRENNNWCWVEGDQRKWVMKFLKEIVEEDKPEQLLKYTVRIKPKTPGLKGGWQLFTKYVSKSNGKIIYGLFYFPWLPSDKYSKGFAIETWTDGNRADDDRPWPP